MIKISKTRAKEALESYWEAMKEHDIDSALSIEREFGLDGYPPDIVTFALTAVAEGRNMYKALDKRMGG
jgi:hypothetical protein